MIYIFKSYLNGGCRIIHSQYSRRAPVNIFFFFFLLEGSYLFSINRVPKLPFSSSAVCSFPLSQTSISCLVCELVHREGTIVRFGVPAVGGRGGRAATVIRGGMERRAGEDWGLQLSFPSHAAVAAPASNTQHWFTQSWLGWPHSVKHVTGNLEWYCELCRLTFVFPCTEVDNPLNSMERLL